MILTTLYVKKCFPRKENKKRFNYGVQAYIDRFYTGDACISRLRELGQTFDFRLVIRLKYKNGHMLCLDKVSLEMRLE